MACTKTLVIAVTAAFLAATSAFAQGAAEPSGVWQTQAGDARVKISKCGGGICGVIVSLKEPIDQATGKPQVDDKNPNPALQQRPIIGLSLLIGMKPSGPAKWSGQIYNADDGKTYVSRVTLANANSLQVQGCVLGGLFCKSMNWTRTN